MRPLAFTAVLGGALCAFAGCGGEQLGYVSEGGSADTGVGNGDGKAVSEGDSPPVRKTGDAAIDAGVLCAPGASSESGGSNGSWSTVMSEMCSDGTTYMAECTCPKETCTCSSTTSTSAMTSTGVRYDGCSQECSVASDAWAACNFPH